VPSRQKSTKATVTAVLLVGSVLCSACAYSIDGTGVGNRRVDSGADRDGGATGTGNAPGRDAEAGALDTDDDTDAGYEADAGPDNGAEDAPAARWRFVVTADTRDTAWGYNPIVFPRLVQAVLREHERSAIDLMLVPGDLVYGAVDVQAELAAWAEAVCPLREAGIAVYPLRGNHELLCDQQCWNSVFMGAGALPGDGPLGEEGLTYSFSHKNALFIGFDNYFGYKVNVDWVQERLDANTRPHVFSFSHEPAFAAYHLDCLDDFVVERDRFWAALEQAGSRAYFCGHDHFYDHARVLDGDGDANDDIHQFIVGTGGGPLYSFSPPYLGNNSGMTLQQMDHAEIEGYLAVEVDDLDVTLTWMELEAGAGASWYYTAKR
jgi:hypothetical protein